MYYGNGMFCFAFDNVPSNTIMFIEILWGIVQNTVHGILYEYGNH